MPSSGIIDLAIGLAFVFGVTAALASVVTELIARFFGLRAQYLLQGLRELLDGDGATTVLATVENDYKALKNLMGQKADSTAAAEGGAERQVPSATGALLGGPILRSQGMAGQIRTRGLAVDSAGLRPVAATPATPPSGPAAAATPGGETGPAGQETGQSGQGATQAPAKSPGKIRSFMATKTTSWKDRRSLPSYIPARSFAEAVIDLVVPNALGQTTMTTLARNIDNLPDEMSPLKPSLQALVKNAGGDINRFRTSVEQWYDDHMDRVSGWYKRHVAKITLAAGAILVLLLNINALTIGRTLYSDSTVRTAVSAVAAKSTSCSKQDQNCLTNLQSQLSAAAKAGLPIGWATVASCTAKNAKCNWWEQRGIISPSGGFPWQLVLVLIGFLITIAALVPGARFWFNLLGKLGSLRSTGPKPAEPAR